MRNIYRILSLVALLLAAAVCAHADVIINEVMASNGTYVNGSAYDWLELYNNGSKTEDISGWYLSNNANKPLKFAFPSGTKIKAGGYILVYCTGEEHAIGKDATFYTSFKISASGETLVLTDKDGTTTRDKLILPKQYGCVSYGLVAGGSEYLFFANATPGKKNDTVGYQSRVSTPTLNIDGGFYDSAVTVTATAADPRDTLRYTTDGSTPTEKSALLTDKGVTFNKTGILRVGAFRADAVPSTVVGATYFINDPSPVPVVSLITDDKYLFNTATGALVKGTGSTPNYEKELEYPTNIEYYTADGLCEINQMGTFTAAGHSARRNAQKSIAIFARKAYGEELFNFNPFPNRGYESYKSLLLRSTNSDAYSTRLRDVVISSLAEDLDILYQDAQPIVVYINGKYWGHYNLREKINKHFIAQYEGVTGESQVDAIDILARTGSDDFVQNGSNKDWLELMDFCRANDLNVPENLAYLDERLDIDSLFTHTIFEIIIGNDDFTNIRMYRVPGGKWKYLLFDVEAGFLSLDELPMSRYIKPLSSKIAGFQHAPLNRLLEVPQMRDKFLKRFAEILETSFLWPYVESKFLPMEEVLETLLPRHLERWPHFTMSEWRTNVNAVKYYARVRPVKIISLLASRMKLTSAEVETYFGHVQELLAQYNTK